MAKQLQKPPPPAKKIRKCHRVKKEPVAEGKEQIMTGLKTSKVNPQTYPMENVDQQEGPWEGWGWESILFFQLLFFFKLKDIINFLSFGAYHKTNLISQSFSFTYFITINWDLSRSACRKGRVNRGGFYLTMAAILFPMIDVVLICLPSGLWTLLLRQKLYWTQSADQVGKSKKTPIQFLKEPLFLLSSCLEHLLYYPF